MIVEYIRYRVPDGGGDRFEDAYARAATSLAAAPQCLDYELSRCAEEKDVYILRITWTSASDHLDGFRRGEHFPAFFAEIKPYVTAIEEMRHYEPTGVRGTGGAVPTLYAWAGGAEAFERLTEIFYRRVLADDLLEPLFRHMDPEHPRHVAHWLAEVFGGPARYTDEHGGYPHMLSKHLGKGITEAQRRRWVALLHDAADDAGLPTDPEFRAAFASYLEWGTRLALANSQPGATPPRKAPVPRWGWGVAPPYQG
ncbi:group II truncated hemoglobin [Bailinhaonella thermotolerans]|uniref:Antibiotic biosynthesis monooxygenase n=1 Tax=Bailinhaonella thermotolerans TaxID=1070861 RepID=A0A3A4BBZ1_9ACTN|nr:antibiotic biosynthesis monooxygenase [Bailinhaonella thermotolerans]RJL31698.1 antibiotic biosynthesis monooxygenase [Bailinhaonella thermotolerans]